MNNTIFDDIFRTMIEKMPYLAVPLINEVFHTSYPQDVPIVQLRTEHQQENGEIITDSCLKIGGKLYHIECQSEEVVRKGIGEIMGGKVLELESERLLAEGKAIGEAEGETKGEERLSVLINRLILDGRSTEIQSVVTNAEIRKQMYKEYGI
jgi:hypothetical protein